MHWLLQGSLQDHPVLGCQQDRGSAVGEGEEGEGGKEGGSARKRRAAVVPQTLRVQSSEELFKSSHQHQQDSGANSSIY